MRGLVTKIKNPKRKNIVLVYQESAERALAEFAEEWSPLSDSQKKYLETTYKNIYYAPYFLGYAMYPTPEEKQKIDKMILSDKRKIAKDLKDAQKEQEELLKAIESQRIKEDKTSTKTTEKTPSAKRRTTKSVKNK